MEEMRDRLTKFIKDAEAGRVRNVWLNDENMGVYVRKGFHLDNDKQLLTWLDIANVEVLQEKRGQGHLKRLIALARELQPWDGLFMESILESRLVGFFQRTGWTRLTTSSDYCPCFYMRSHVLPDSTKPGI